MGMAQNLCIYIYIHYIYIHFSDNYTISRWDNHPVQTKVPYEQRSKPAARRPFLLVGY